MKKIIFISILLLSGCVSAQQQSMLDSQTCLNYGFDPYSQAFASCKMQLANNRISNNNAAWAAYANAYQTQPNPSVQNQHCRTYYESTTKSWQTDCSPGY